MTLQSRNASPLYKAEAEWVKNVHSTRQKLAGICAQCLNRTVRVQTIDGHTFEGVVIGHDHTYLHIASRDTRFWGPLRPPQLRRLSCSNFWSLLC
ncbi:LSm family protein [Cohnella faecalis]|uniref:DUF2642 domain-containing protein n=1 Tax=Cohnella faecalis TaxID=2315694 RepID=A0A398CFL6_9BACL|nr:hypothetical protein [Cohnella faecalis]RIE01986.1 hypothetical protein D3H35_14555 [Cohnella faecalis]